MTDVVIESKPTKRKVKDIEVERGTNIPKNKLVKAKDIARKIKSFDHFLYVWGHKGGYYMPPKTILTWHYISQILAREKRLLKMEEVGYALKIPKVRGSMVNDMYHQIKNEKGLHMYFPDLTETQNVPRDYFFNVRLKRC